MLIVGIEKIVEVFLDVGERVDFSYQSSVFICRLPLRQKHIGVDLLIYWSALIIPLLPSDSLITNFSGCDKVLKEIVIFTNKGLKFSTSCLV